MEQLGNFIVADILGTGFNLDINKPIFSFIPSKSSIDFKGSNRQLKEDISKRNMICSEETPFDSYYMPEKNQGHIQLTRANTDFILNEINKKPQDPIYHLDANSIQGQGLLCDGSVRIFSVPNCKKDPGITLQASPDLKTLAQGPGSITVQAGDQNGKSWIKAFDRNGRLLGQKDIWVGKPKFKLEYDTRYNYARASVRGVDLSRENQYITSTQWQVENNAGEVSFTGYGFGAYADAAHYNWSISGTVGVGNACGTTKGRFYLRPEFTSDECLTKRYILCRRRNFDSMDFSPNDKVDSVPYKIQSYIIYDLMGIEIKRKSNPSPMEDSLAGLPLGQYIIKYRIGGRWHKESAFVK